MTQHSFFPYLRPEFWVESGMSFTFKISCLAKVTEFCDSGPQPQLLSTFGRKLDSRSPSSQFIFWPGLDKATQVCLNGASICNALFDGTANI